MKDADLKHLKVLYQELVDLREDIILQGNEIISRWSENVEDQDTLYSIQNLAYYMAFRKNDLRALQSKLQRYGLSSLGRLESRVIENLDTILVSIANILASDTSFKYPSKESFYRGQQILEKNTDCIIGPQPADRYSRIMVTLPTQAATDKYLIHSLIQNGTDVVRINCAHDDSVIWKKMIDNVKKANESLNKNCKIAMDIAGPKIRTNRLLTTLKDVKINTGDLLFLTGEQYLTDFYSIPLVVDCTVPEIVKHIKVNDPVHIDDGHIKGIVEEVKPEGVVIRITHCFRQGGVRLKCERGLNFPKLDYKTDILTEKDRADLDFVCQHADIIGISFVKDNQDIQEIQDEINTRLHPKRKNDVSLMIKIETLEIIDVLPSVILKAMTQNKICVMIARGDLAIEVGYERLSELQEEIQWICEAAHIPVIWATQVLENLVKTGIPTRAEMSDITLGSKSECIMLNKGDYLNDAVILLNDVLARFSKHQYKKDPKLRALGIAGNMWNN
ncbi:MAG: hypothetical protein GX245_03960 [Eubacteriaceae bacterium]|jgi:pyruvate kinase|nr:hypothetical protein [Eubacteriaceae bacterium]